VPGLVLGRSRSPFLTWRPGLSQTRAHRMRRGRSWTSALELTPLAEALTWALWLAYLVSLTGSCRLGCVVGVAVSSTKSALIAGLWAASAVVALDVALA
jgi:hypothetical protein